MVTRINCWVQFSELWQSRKPKWSYFKTSKFSANEVCKVFVHIPRIKELSNHRNLDGGRRGERYLHLMHLLSHRTWMGKVRVNGHRWGWREVRGSSGKCLRILEKEENKNSILYLFFFYQNKSRFFFFFSSSFFPPCDSLAAWVCLHCPHFQLQMLGLCKQKKKKKSSCFWSNQSRRRLLSLWCHQQLPTCQLAHKTGMWPASTCWVDCRGTSCWRNPLAAACHFPVLPAWGDTEACKLPGHLGLLEYTLQCFPMTAGPSAE